MKKSLRSFLVILLLSGLFSGIARGQGASDESFSKIHTVLEYINHYYVDTVDQELITDHAIKEMLKKLDPHCQYIPKKNVEEANEPLRGNFEGIGIQFNIISDTIAVVAPIAGGPSEKLGIISGDKIVSIDGENVAGINITNENVVKKLRGPKGTKVDVQIYRRGNKKLLDFTIERDKIPIRSIDAVYKPASDVGYVKINRFAATTMREFREAKEKLQGVSNLILDLRGNAGGYMNVAIELADEFLSQEKLIVYTEGKKSPKSGYTATTYGDFEEGKLIVLIDEGSASASEIVSGAIQDWDRGIVIGRRSFGKGLVQKPIRLKDGSEIRLTIARYHTPSGRCIQKPYEEGVKAYHEELVNRYKNGELSHDTEFDFPDSLKYYTQNKREVYGGGGIMPDVFVSIDTTWSSEYYTKILRKGLISRFSLEYTDKNRGEISKYPDLATFKKDFKTDKVMDELIAFAEKEGVEKDEEGFKKSEKFIVAQVKGLIARQFWDFDAYYEIMNELDQSFQKALEVMKDENKFNAALKIASK